MEFGVEDRRTRLNAEGGFTLIEMTIAIGLFAMLLTAFVGASLSASALAGHSGDRAFALKQAQTVLNTIRGARDAGVIVPGGIVQQYPAGPIVMAGNQLSNQVTTIAYANVNATPLSITVTVTWSEPQGRRVSERLSALLGP